MVPLKASRSLRVGRIVGPAEHREQLAGMAAVRPVEWESGEVASRVLAPDLRNALGSIMTVFGPGAQAAERRLESLLLRMAATQERTEPDELDQEIARVRRAKEAIDRQDFKADATLRATRKGNCWLPVLAGRRCGLRPQLAACRWSRNWAG